MRQKAAKQGDQILQTIPCIHIVNVPGPVTPVPLPHPCSWEISENLSSNVSIEGKAAATVDSGGDNAKRGIVHIPTPPGTSFFKPPPTMDKATIAAGSGSVRINGRAAARQGDACNTCSEPVGNSCGVVSVAGASTVWIGA